MTLPRIHSVSKKIFVALLGGFLLLFLLFHATANLLILRHDEGAWYSAFCHFMGTNWVVKIFEVLLLCAIAFHALLTLWLALTNRRARPVRYRQPQRTKTHAGSKLMVWTGILILVCMVMHFTDFYFVKLGWVKGEYQVRTERLQSGRLAGLMQFAEQMNLSPAEMAEELESGVQQYGDSAGLDPQTAAYVEEMRGQLAVLNILQRAYDENLVSGDGQWIRHLTYDERQTLREVLPESDPEPDFYYMARQKFRDSYLVVMYLLFFAVVFLHLRHAFPSMFQTLGLNNYKYCGAVEVLGKVYCWLVTLMFAAVPILVYLGL
ncbi:MAG: succinate dehydrogenase cytochrome b556 subunit [bacterium P3]|nr:MAG: succinate dehydrogenase cytochrome b556 subunit [bacterium P3]KWW41926.1 MAG: succinate dehydrogenase cytochrome b556 subunit [bacterium F083]